MDSWQGKLRMGMVGGGQGAFIGWEPICKVVTAIFGHVIIKTDPSDDIIF